MPRIFLYNEPLARIWVLRTYTQYLGIPYLYVKFGCNVRILRIWVYVPIPRIWV